MLKKHTRSQLINFAPSEMLFQHMGKINVPEFIVNEVWEQKEFIGDSKKKLMCNWSIGQFWNWYQSEDNL
jgi:hypothetical protein